MKKILILGFIMMLAIILFYQANEKRNSDREIFLGSLSENEIRLKGLGGIHSQNIILFEYDTDENNMIRLETTHGVFLFYIEDVIEINTSELSEMKVEKYDFTYSNEILYKVDELKSELGKNGGDDSFVEFTFDLFQEMKEGKIVNPLEYKVRYHGKLTKETSKEVKGIIVLELQNKNGFKWEVITIDTFDKE